MTESARVTYVWAGLVMATGITVWLGVAHPFAASSPRLVPALAIVIASGKAWFIGLDFMEIRGAAPGLRLAFQGWLLTVTATLVTLILI